ncbi:hypothetical protein [Paraflavitalea speifideaquila]|uniref:hypothetical protein n=1 Tax=Paraflavitalea speifideaquila TaxID=3076558 RepID=UPI0028EE4096|nr:hypothetical protein [Paraflavitalea speifideiaquila]
MRPFLFLCLLIVFCFALTPLQAQRKINTGHFVQTPESVATDGRYYYIADIGKELKAGDKDGDGTIWKMDKAGRPYGDSAFVKGLNAPKGAVINNDILFLSDIDHVLGFDLGTGKRYMILIAGVQAVYSSTMWQ